MTGKERGVSGRKGLRRSVVKDKRGVRRTVYAKRTAAARGYRWNQAESVFERIGPGKVPGAKVRGRRRYTVSLYCDLSTLGIPGDYLPGEAPQDGENFEYRATVVGSAEDRDALLAAAQAWGRQHLTSTWTEKDERGRKRTRERTLPFKVGVESRASRKREDAVEGTDFLLDGKKQGRAPGSWSQKLRSALGDD